MPYRFEKLRFKVLSACKNSINEVEWLLCNGYTKAIQDLKFCENVEKTLKLLLVK